MRKTRGPFPGFRYRRNMPAQHDAALRRAAAFPGIDGALGALREGLPDSGKAMGQREGEKQLLLES